MCQNIDEKELFVCLFPICLSFNEFGITPVLEDLGQVVLLFIIPSFLEVGSVLKELDA